MTRLLEVETVKDVLAAFFEGLESRDDGTIRRLWHPDARLFLNSAILNTRTLPFLLTLPEMMNFQVQEIEIIDVRELVATARVDYQLSIGCHSGFFHLVKANGRWLIANWVDYGFVGNRPSRN